MTKKEKIAIIKRCYEYRYSQQTYENSHMRATYEDIIMNMIDVAIKKDREVNP